MRLDTKTLALALAALAALAAAAILLAGQQGGGGEVTLQGAGSTFIAPQLYQWADSFSRQNPGVTISYASVGSGAGIAQFREGTVDFAASDPPLSRQAWQELRGQALQIPVVLGAVAVVYNIPGLEGQLRLTGEVLALIYQGEIEQWSDERIARLNPGLQLPDEDIIVVHRSDSSGTTQVFTTFLHKSAPHAWPAELVGKTIDWPVDKTGRGVGGKGNEGVTQTVLNTPYSIGYVELSYAIENGLQTTLLRNGNGEFVAPTREAVQEAVEAILDLLPGSPADDWSKALDLIVYPRGGGYPLVSFTFLVFKTQYPPEKVDAIKRWIEYINTQGQEELVQGYFPIPEALRQVNLKALEMIQAQR